MTTEALALFLDQDELAILDAYREKVAAAKAVELAPIVNEEQLAQSNELLSKVKSLRTKAEEARKDMVKPLNDQVKTINDAWRPLGETCESIIARIGGPQGVQTVYMVAKRKRAEAEAREAEARRLEAARKQDEALRKAEAAKSIEARENAMAKARAAEADMQALAVVAEAPPARGIATDAGKSSLVRRVRWEVADVAKVPAQFLTVDSAKVDRWATACKDEVERAIADGKDFIPGLRFYIEESLSTRR